MKALLGSRNRLVRRLGRHANMTGLFQFGGAVQRQTVRLGEPGRASAAHLAGLPLAKAFMPMHEPAGETAMIPPANIVSAPEMDRAALPAGEADLTPSAAAYPSPEVRLAGQEPGPAQVEPLRPVPEGSVFRAPETEQIESPPAEEKSQPPENDPVWNRLQNIFNKHKAKNTTQEAASLSQSQEMESSPPATSTPTTEVTGQASASPLPEPPTLNQSLTPPIQMKRETASSSSVQHATASPKINSEANVVPDKQEPANVAGSAEASFVIPASPPEGIGVVPKRPAAVDLPSSSEVKEAPTVKPPATIPSGETGEPARSEQPDTTLSQPLMEAPDTPATSLQSLPLEAVWAVETVRQPKSHVPPPPDESDKLISGQEEIDRPPESADIDQPSVQRKALQDDVVRSALQDVQPAQATESGIEFLPPRRPRPVPLPGESNAPIRENIDLPAETPQAALQRQVDPTPRNELLEPGVVQTEIGPLPEDLWNLAGAATPPKATHPATNEAPSERPVDGNFSNRENKVPIYSAPPPSSRIGQASQPPVVQRQVASAASVEPGSTPASPGEAASAEQAGEEVNIEELARQVYSELKHRLGLEWERLRRR